MADIIKVKLTRSLIGHPEKHRRVLEVMGLTRINRVREFSDNPSVRGMIRKVRHMVQVVE